jgi:hypothetical protein
MGAADELSDLADVGKAAVRTHRALKRDGEEDGGISAIVEYAVLGDIYEIVHEERKPPLVGIGIRMVITFIPYVDQAADVEDMGAWIYIASTRGVDDPMVKLQGVLCFIGVIPTVGSAARGVLKVVANNPRSLKPVVATLNAIGDGGHGVRWLREFAADMPKHADDAAQLARKAVDGLIDHLGNLRSYRLMPRSAVRKIDGWIESLREVSDAIPSMFSETADMLKGRLDELLAEFDAKDFDLRSAARDDAFRKQTRALPSDGHGAIDDVSDGRGVVVDAAPGGGAQPASDLPRDGGVVDVSGRGSTAAEQDPPLRTPSLQQLRRNAQQTGDPYKLTRQSDAAPGIRDKRGQLYRGDSRSPEEIKAAGGFRSWAPDADTTLADHITDPSHDTPWISTTKSENIARWYATNDGAEGAVYRFVQPGGVDMERVGMPGGLYDPLIDGLMTQQVAHTDSIPWENIHSYARPTSESAPLQWTRNPDYAGPNVPDW